MRRAVAVAVLLVSVGCRRPEPSVEIVLTGTPRDTWVAVVAPCLAFGWDWRVSESSTEPGKAVVRVPAGQYDPRRTPEIAACLERQPGIERAAVQGEALG